ARPHRAHKGGRMNALSISIPLLTGLPLVGFCALGFALLMGRKPQEPLVNRTVGLIMFLHMVILTWLSIPLLFNPAPIEASLGTLSAIHLPLTLFLDRTSAGLLWASSLLCGVVGFFSTRY